MAACQIASYGKGTKTLVDTRVRKTFELDAQKFRLGDQWKSAIAYATRTVATALGLPADRLEARLYRLLVYDKGGFFLPHRDSEKHDRMVASLIVVLPNPFQGGRLIVRHGAVKQKLAFEEAASTCSPGRRFTSRATWATHARGTGATIVRARCLNARARERPPKLQWPAVKRADWKTQARRNHGE